MANKKLLVGDVVNSIPVHTTFVDGDVLVDPLGGDLGLGSSLDKPFYLSASYIGTPQPLEIVFMHTMADKLRFPVNFTGSRIHCATPPTTNTVFIINKNGNFIGTVTFSHAEANGVIDVANETFFDINDILTVVAPSNLNNIADLTFNFMAFGLTGAAAGMTTFILEASNIQANSFRVSWTPVENATAYKIYESGVLVETLNAPNVFYDFTGRSASTSHTITVGVVVGGIEQPQQPQPGLVVVTLNSPVAVPSVLSAPIIHTDTFRVSWGAVPGATAYRVYINGLDPVITMNTFFDKWFLTRTSKTPANQHTISVTSLNGTSESALSSPLVINTIDLPDAACQTYIAAIGGDSIKIAWRENIWATKYELQCGTHHMTVSAGQLEATFTGLDLDTYYDISVEYYNNDSLLDTDILSATTLIDTNKIKFFATGHTQFWTPPVGVTTLNMKIWGAGGNIGAGGNAGGSGGYSEMLSLPASSLYIQVGQSLYNSYGGGGNGGTNTGGNGGGRTAIFRDDKVLLLVAGGGGGGASAGAGAVGGAGGGVQGGAGAAGGFATTGGGLGATLTAPGAGGYKAEAGTGYAGGVGSVNLYMSANTGGGSGGGGYYGGGGGGYGYDNSNGLYYAGGGGGGSGYIKVGYTGETKVADTATNADTDRGLAGNSGVDGVAVIWW